MLVSSELCTDASSHFRFENNHKQTEIAMVQFQLEELSVAFSYEFNS